MSFAPAKIEMKGIAMGKLSEREILGLKGKRKLTMTTALNYFEAKIVEEAGIDEIGLGGTAVEMNFKGMPNGTKSNLEELLIFITAVRRGAPDTFIMASIPYGYSFMSDDETLRTAVAMVKAGTDAVKIQGGSAVKAAKIRRITSEGIPCQGHVGLETMYAERIGGFQCVGKKAEDAVEIYEGALRVQDAGAFQCDFEDIPHRVAGEISKRLSMLTIGAGSGPDCDIQVVTYSDLLATGYPTGKYPKHAKQYLNIYDDSIDALKRWKKEVDAGVFPDPKKHSFTVDDDEFERFLEAIDR